MSQARTLKDSLITAVAPVIWGSTYIVTSDCLPPDRPFTAAFIRAFPAGLLLLLWVRQFPLKHEWGKVLTLAFLNIGAFQALLFVSAYRLPGGQAATIAAVQPMILMALMWAVDKKSYSGVAVGSAVTALVGMVLLFMGDGFVWDFVGIAASIGMAVCMALGIYLAGRWRLSLPVMASTGWQLLLGGVMLVPIACIYDPALSDLGIKQILAYAYLSLFGAMFAYFLWFRGIARLPAVAVGSLGLISPITAVIIGWTVLGQALDGMGLIGLVLALGSIFSLQLANAKSSSK